MKSGATRTTCAIVRAVRAITLSAVLAVTAVNAQTSLPVTAGDPGPNSNVVGPTVVNDVWDIRDVALKSQNEPACGVRPGNNACYLCAYNDNRTVDVPAVGDGWISMSTSCDGGVTWTSRPIPGHNAHPAPIGETFAADPRLLVLPGFGPLDPGVAILGFIAGDRDSDRGVAAVQHWPAINQEDADHYEPALNTTIVDLGSEGRFVDKPELFGFIDPPDQQRPVTIRVQMEDPSLGVDGFIERTVPSGLLFMAWATFTGDNGGSKIFYKVSTDWGQTWRNQSYKLSEEQNLVSGIAMTGIGDEVVAVWRRVADNNDFNEFLVSRITQDGKKSSKGEVIASVCAFDQLSETTSSTVTFRTNDFPWLANDGNNYFLFYSDRGFGGSDCLSGRPRIVFKQSTDGLNWGGPATAIDDSAATDTLSNGEIPAGDGFQFMPAAFGANGEILVAWYDTRREELPAPGEDVAFVADYPSPAGRVFRQLDVYSTRIRSAGPGLAPEIADPIRVSQYRIAAEIITPGEGPGEVDTVERREGEANFPNARIYASGTLAFIGDYIAAAASAFRLAGEESSEYPERWISNASQDPTFPLTDFIVAWGDNRDVRGSILNPDPTQPTPYSPTTSDGGAARSKLPTDRLDASFKERPLRAEGIVANEDAPELCTPGAPQDRTRDANIRASIIQGTLQVTAATPAKPLTNLMRAFAVGISNFDTPPTPDAPARAYRLAIATQPCGDFTQCRASFRQLPAIPPFDVPVADVEGERWVDFEVPFESTIARTVFVVSNTDSTTVLLGLYDNSPGSCVQSNPDTFLAACAPEASTIVGGTGSFEQPNYDSPVCEGLTPEECTIDVLRAELHNPQILNPQILNPQILNPQILNLDPENPQILNPQILNPQILNPQILNFGYENPQILNPQILNLQVVNDGFENPQILNPQILNPQILNPQILNTTLPEGSTTTDDVTWIDFTYAVRNTGNVSTALNGDMTLAGEGLENTDSQFFAWTIYASPTARDCQYVAEADVRILSQLTTQDNELAIANINDPFAGDLSAVAVPGQVIYWTRRVWGAPEDLQTLAVDGFTTSSQSANCTDIVPDGETGDFFCQETLGTDRELIVLDTLAPQFDAQDGDFLPNVEAIGPGGGCLVFEGDSLVTADDNGTVVYPFCTLNGAPGDEVCIAGTSPQQEPLPVPLTQLGLPATVTCTVADDAGNVASVTLNVNVFDTTAPQLGAPLVPGPLEVTANATLPPENPLTAAVSYPPIAAVDDPPVDLDVEVLCFPESGSEFPIGSHTVSCTARDDGPNGSAPPDGPFNESAPEEFTVVVADVTAPTGVDPSLPAVEANAPGGANYTFADPVFTDNDTRDSNTITVSCTPASPAFLPLLPPEGPTSTITCTGEDQSGNIGSLSFSVTVQDTTAPEFTSVPTSPVVVAIDSDGLGRLDFESRVTVEDVDGVDPDPVVSCAAGSGQVSGEGLPLGLATISCTATDASGNSATASYEVRVTYGDPVGILVGKNNVKAGSSVPLRFGFEGAGGQLVDSSGADPVVSARDCATGSNVVLSPGEFPGNSDLRYDASQKLWKFNWQTVFMDGSPIPGDTYCLQVTSLTTGQTIPETGFTRVRVRN